MHDIRQGDYAAAKRRLVGRIEQGSARPEHYEKFLRVVMLDAGPDAPGFWTSASPKLDRSLKRPGYALQLNLAAPAATGPDHDDHFLQNFQAYAATAIDQAVSDGEGFDAFLAEISAAGSVALVGNGPSLLGSANGRDIDGFGLVLRCNFPRLEGLENDVGSRTDIMLFVESIAHEVHTPQWLDQHPTYAAARLASIANPGSRIPSPRDALSRVGVTRYSRLPANLSRLSSAISYGTRTTGCNAALILGAILQKPLTLFGFDFYSAERHHFWDQEKPRPGLHHEPMYEKLLIRKFLKRYFAVSAC